MKFLSVVVSVFLVAVLFTGNPDAKNSVQADDNYKVVVKDEPGQPSQEVKVKTSGYGSACAACGSARSNVWRGRRPVRVGARVLTAPVRLFRRIRMNSLERRACRGNVFAQQRLIRVANRYR